MLIILLTTGIMSASIGADGNAKVQNALKTQEDNQKEIEG